MTGPGRIDEEALLADIAEIRAHLAELVQLARAGYPQRPASPAPVAGLPQGLAPPAPAPLPPCGCEGGWGTSSDPRPRRAHSAPNGNGVRPGVGPLQEAINRRAR